MMICVKLLSLLSQERGLKLLGRYLKLLVH